MVKLLKSNRPFFLFALEIILTDNSTSLMIMSIHCIFWVSSLNYMYLHICVLKYFHRDFFFRAFSSFMLLMYFCICSYTLLLIYNIAYSHLLINNFGIYVISEGFNVIVYFSFSLIYSFCLLFLCWGFIYVPVWFFKLDAWFINMLAYLLDIIF